MREVELPWQASMPPHWFTACSTFRGTTTPPCSPSCFAGCALAGACCSPTRPRSTPAKTSSRATRNFCGRPLFYSHTTPLKLRGQLEGAGFACDSAAYRDIGGETFLWITVQRPITCPVPDHGASTPPAAVWASRGVAASPTSQSARRIGPQRPAATEPGNPMYRRPLPNPFASTRLRPYARALPCSPPWLWPQGAGREIRPAFRAWSVDTLSAESEVRPSRRGCWRPSSRRLKRDRSG